MLPADTSGRCTGLARWVPELAQMVTRSASKAGTARQRRAARRAGAAGRPPCTARFFFFFFSSPGPRTSALSSSAPVAQWLIRRGGAGEVLPRAAQRALVTLMRTFQLVVAAALCRSPRGSRAAAAARCCCPRGRASTSRSPAALRRRAGRSPPATGARRRRCRPREIAEAGFRSAEDINAAPRELVVTLRLDAPSAMERRAGPPRCCPGVRNQKRTPRDA